MKYQATIELNNPDKIIKITLEDEKEPYTFSFGRAYTLKGLLKRGTVQLKKETGVNLERPVFAHRNNTTDFYTVLYTH